VVHRNNCAGNTRQLIASPIVPAWHNLFPDRRAICLTNRFDPPPG